MSVDPRICPVCGARDERFTLVSEQPPTLACGSCGAGRTFRRLPLFCLTGPSGTGKSTVAALVAPAVAAEVVTLEQDVLWSPDLADAPGGVRRFRATWLRLAATVGQSGRPVLLCGTVHPDEVEPLPERALFSEVHYLVLVCEPDVLAERLRARPPWRGWDEARIAETLEYAELVRADAAAARPPLTLLDTTCAPAQESAGRAVSWLRALLPAEVAAPVSHRRPSSSGRPPPSGGPGR